MRLLDTSVAMKWIVREAGSDEAPQLIGHVYIAPDLLHAELAHALSWRCRAGEFDIVQVPAGQPLVESASHGRIRGHAAAGAACGRDLGHGARPLPLLRTPLTYGGDGSDGINLTVGSLDHPAMLTPVEHSGVESLHPARLDTSSLKRQRTDENENIELKWMDACGKLVD
jgi:hypothetical protein